MTTTVMIANNNDSVCKMRELTANMLPFIENVTIESIKTIFCKYGRAVYNVMDDMFQIGDIQLGFKIIDSHKILIQTGGLSFISVIAHGNLYFLQKYASIRFDPEIPWFYDEPITDGFPIYEWDLEKQIRNMRV